MKKVLVLDAPNKHSKVVCSIIESYGVEVELFAVCDKGGTCTNNKLAEGLVYGLFGCFDIINVDCCFWVQLSSDVTYYHEQYDK